MVGKRRQRRGVRAGKRTHQHRTDPALRPARVRSRAEVAAYEAALDAEVARGQAQTAAALEQRRREEATAAAIARALRAAQARARADADADVARRRREGWNLGQARALIRQGYTVEQAARLTGWEAEWLT